MKLTEIERAKGLLMHALTATSTMAATEVAEARGHIRRAIEKLDKVSESKGRKQDSKTQYDQWWGHIVSGVAHEPMSAVATQKSLKQLNAMIAEEEQKLSKLEKSSKTAKIADDLLID